MQCYSLVTQSLTSGSSLITCAQLNLAMTVEPPNGCSTCWSFFPSRTDELEGRKQINERNSAWWDNFVSETVIEKDRRENFRMSRWSLYKWDSWGRGNFWISKETFADSKISGCVWTGRQALDFRLFTFSSSQLIQRNTFLLCWHSWRGISFKCNLRSLFS